MAQWSLSQDAFEGFLGSLDPEREVAGQKYQALRVRVVKFFEWRACRSADDLADEALDRVARKLQSGEQINDIANYTYGVSRLLYLETVRQQSREQPLDMDTPDLVTDRSDDEDGRQDCLEKCLSQIPDNSRAVILGYYAHDKQAKIDHRRDLAQRLNVSVNALRIKALRIRTALESCVLKCMEGK